jgi:hypothetical protein
MSEQQPKPPESSQPDQIPEADHVERRYPTKKELRKFENHRAYQRDNLPFWELREIDTFAKDPNSPTSEEIQAVENYNRDMGLVVDTFEEYFGYPDPRDRRSLILSIRRRTASRSGGPVPGLTSRPPVDGRPLQPPTEVRPEVRGTRL